MIKPNLFRGLGRLQRFLIQPKAKQRSTAALGFAFFVLATSCGISEGEVDLFTNEEHADLLGQDLAQTGGVQNSEDRFAVYFVGQDRALVKLSREGPRKLETVLAALTEGPLETEVERFGELETTLPTSLAPTATSINKETMVLRIDVGPEAQLRSEVEQKPSRGRLIFSQIVCTVTNLRSDIIGIEIFDDASEAIRVADSDGQRIDGPAKPSDFDDCRTVEPKASSSSRQIN